MNYTFDYRPSDSPLVETIWHAYSPQAFAFTSVAVSHWEMVVTRYQGKTTLTVRGPESQASQAVGFEDAETLGIQFKLGTFMPHLPTLELVDTFINLPETGHRQAVWLHGGAWEIPTFTNADDFVTKLVHAGLLVRDPIVAAVLQNQRVALSPRTVQRRFLHATGLTHGTLDQIERARQSALLLEEGLPIADAVFAGGYADQPHLTRSLKRFLGLTPAQLLHGEQVTNITTPP